MNLLSVIFFFVISMGLGSLLLRFVKESDDLLEKYSMRVAAGLAFFIPLGVVFSLFGIPLDWKLFLGLSLIAPSLYFIKTRKLPRLNVNLTIKKRQLYSIAVLAIFLFSLFMYVGGSFKYPFLENDDPWAYAESTKFVSNEKTLASETGFKYLDPYPPGYSLLMGVVHQTNDSLQWTLKFFNGLLLSLSVLFFYFFAKQFTGSRKKALFSTFVIASLPSFFTHFIWAHTLAIMFMFPTLYFFEKIKANKKWILPGAISTAAILLSQPSQAIKIGIMFFIYLAVTFVYERRAAVRIFSAGVLGVALSMIWWANKAAPIMAGRLARASQHAEKFGSEISTNTLLQKISALFTDYFTPDSGTASRAYNFADFVFAKSFGGINIQVGWGLAASILLLLGLFYGLARLKKLSTKDKQVILISTFWFIFAFIGVNAMTFNLPIGFITFRFWLLLAIPVALLSAFGWEFLLKFTKKKEVKLAITVIVVLAIFFTATQQKYVHNNSEGWPPGVAWTSMEELNAYAWLDTLPANSRVFAPSYVSARQTLGFDKMSCTWCEEDIAMRERIVDVSPVELHAWLIENNYDYFIVGGRAVTDLTNKFGEEKANEFMTELVNSLQGNLFSILFQNQGAVIFSVNK